MLTPFMTGSRVYGTPGDSSQQPSPPPPPLGPDGLAAGAHLANYAGCSLRFGKLNLICPPTPEAFAAWRKATTELVARKPVTREQAVEAITAELDRCCSETEGSP